MKIKKATLNMVTGQSKLRNPFYFKKILKAVAETDCVVFHIPDKILQLFGTLRQKFIKRKSPWSNINIRSTLENHYSDLTSAGDTRTLKLLLTMFKVRVVPKDEIL